MNVKNENKNNINLIDLRDLPEEVVVCITRELAFSDMISLSRVSKAFYFFLYDFTFNCVEGQKFLSKRILRYNKENKTKEVLLGFYFLGIAMNNLYSAGNGKQFSPNYCYKFLLKYKTDLFTTYVRNALEKIAKKEEGFTSITQLIKRENLKIRSMFKSSADQYIITSIFGTLKRLSCDGIKSSDERKVVKSIKKIIISNNYNFKMPNSKLILSEFNEFLYAIEKQNAESQKSEFSSEKFSYLSEMMKEKNDCMRKMALSILKRIIIEEGTSEEIAKDGIYSLYEIAVSEQVEESVRKEVLSVLNAIIHQKGVSEVIILETIEYLNKILVFTKNYNVKKTVLGIFSDILKTKNVSEEIIQAVVAYLTKFRNNLSK